MKSKLVLIDFYKFNAHYMQLWKIYDHLEIREEKMKNTPLYILNKDRIVECYQDMSAKLNQCDIFYSMKANPDINVVKILKEENCGFEISSLEEFQKVLSVRAPLDRILCGLPIKKVEMIEYMYENGVRYFGFDDMKELIKLNKYAPDAKKILRIYISDIIPDSIEYGMNQKNIEENENELLSSIDGVAFHISKNGNIEFSNRVLDRSEEIIRKLNKDKPIILNIGGGYESNFSEDYYPKLNERLKELKNKYNLQIIAEPGSAIINKGVRIRTKVILVKEREGFYDVYLDAGIPTGLMRKPGSIQVINRSVEKGKRKIYRFLDITSLHRPLFQIFLKHDIQEEDLLDLEECGAYTISYINQFHSWPEPMIIVD
ncbi:ornithine decarboxylase [Paenibacillus sp. JGP012]|uniref:hypothetical protein n=1 Tax=Paenibacillus sp. JGP012 TaxID=2735914 RepID=UPI001616AB4F|nr:hypothetical protein [Paenibacillus sp. JGP012]MBB6022773.1 ornithine decarboxylase [Paenibacillus sp. JGP012]